MRAGRVEAVTIVAAGFLSTCAVASVLAQQAYPGRKAIEMTVMFDAGSAADVTARYLADGMSSRLNVPVPVVNRTGGGGATAYSYVRRQQPDGYSVIWNSNSISTIYHSGVLAFDYSAFEAVARVSIETPVIAVRADAPWKTLKDLMEYAKANPGMVRIGNSGKGSHTHLSAAALFSEAAASVVHVSCAEGQPVVKMLGQRFEGIVQLPVAIVPHVRSGDLRVLAVLGSRRNPLFPDVATASEAGYAVTLDMWRGIAAPKGTPRPLVGKLQDAIKAAVESAPFINAGEAIGYIPAYLGSEDFAALIARDDARLAQVMAELGLKMK
jgi:tripartite-type tricarboxylate transporter receptor subunit TctC